MPAGRRRDGRGIRRGDAYVLNDPYRGGTHLPDITVIVPVFYGEEAEPSAFVAARGHHADIGGIAPGSMPPDSKSIADEGVLIDNMLLVDEGHFREAEMRALLASGPHPARNPDRNISDLRAQLAACVRGAETLAADRARLRAGGGRRLHGPRPRQCRGIGAAPARPARRRRVRLRDGQWRAGRGEDHASTRRRARRPSISPAPARSCPTISTRLSRSSAPPRSMSCAP